jgi:hypothetical protein
MRTQLAMPALFDAVLAQLKKNRANTAPAKKWQASTSTSRLQNRLAGNDAQASAADASGKVCKQKKRGISERLWISQSISTG